MDSACSDSAIPGADSKAWPCHLMPVQFALQRDGRRLARAYVST